LLPRSSGQLEPLVRTHVEKQHVIVHLNGYMINILDFIIIWY
jgi:hypothetical protein